MSESIAAAPCGSHCGGGLARRVRDYRSGAQRGPYWTFIRERATSDERRVTSHLTGRGRDLQERAAGIPEAIAGRVVDDEAGYEAMKAQLNDLAAQIALSRADGSGGGGPGHVLGHTAFGVGIGLWAPRFAERRSRP